jgi:cobaltochelatase CobS
LSVKVGTKYCLGGKKTKTAAPVAQEAVMAPAQATNVVEFKPEPKRSSTNTSFSYVPDSYPGFVKFGVYNDVEAIIASRKFFPLYVVGLSGNGKTLTIRQVCAKLKRELIQININPQTDEDDLIGGLRLRDGSTIFDEGPVLTAMRKGAILLLDEIDRGSNRLMCLQSIMEGRPFYVKKTGETVIPAPGFNIIATANTKGRGSDDGRYSAAAFLDDAFLERFPITLAQEYPPEHVEQRIVENAFEQATGDRESDFAKLLVTWTTVVRKSFQNEAVSEQITTRRLVHIVETFSIFRDRLASIQKCISRFDDTNRTSLLDLYTKVDASVTMPVVEEPAVVSAPQESPF